MILSRHHRGVSPSHASSLSTQLSTLEMFVYQLIIFLFSVRFQLTFAARIKFQQLLLLFSFNACSFTSFETTLLARITFVVRNAILHISVQKVESVVDQFSPSLRRSLGPRDDNSNNFLRVCTSIRAHTYRHRCLADRHGFSIFSGNGKHHAISRALITYVSAQPLSAEHFDIFFINGSTISLSRITTSLFEQNLIIFRCVFMDSTPQMLNILEHIIISKIDMLR